MRQVNDNQWPENANNRVKLHTRRNTGIKEYPEELIFSENTPL